MRKQKIAVKVNDRRQKNYVYYLTELAGRNFLPDFKPELTPKEMLELGVFGGKYLTAGGSFLLHGSNAPGFVMKSTMRSSTFSK